MLVADICGKLTDDLDDKCKDQSVDCDDPDKAEDVKILLDGVLNRLVARATKVGRFSGFTASDVKKISSEYAPLVEMRVKRSFRRYDLKPAKLKSIEKLVFKVIASNLFSRDHSGFVIAGYGEKENYPSIIHKRSDGFIAGKLKIVNGLDAAITNKNRAVIYPFAQTDVAQLFVEGVASSYQKFIERSVSDILSGLAATTAKYFKIKDAKKVSLLRKKLVEQARQFSIDLKNRRHSEFIKPMVDAVRHLDKAELAMLALDLVSITALKQKISLDIETVGGPIDVAVISKGDGFIWIKRKHYFETSLNPIFAQKYLTGSKSSTE